MKESGYFLDLLKLDIEKYPVIAVVGGGGKTSLIYRLNEELQALGKKVIISTTTHMAFDPMLPRIGSDELDKLPQMLENHGFVAVADIEEASGKMCSIEAGKLQKLASLCDVMLIEADGAKHKPLNQTTTESTTITFEGSGRLGAGDTGICGYCSKRDRSGLPWQAYL